MPVEGDNSFSTLAVPHMEAVYRVARRMARNEHEAEDLVQETYLKAYKGFQNFEMREFGIKPWLFKILQNTFINRRAREGQAPRATDQARLERTPTNVDGNGLRAPDLDYERLDDDVKRAIDGLQPEFRTVMLLWATMELSYQEIAQALSVPIGTVMSRLHRARQHLTVALEGYARENRLTLAKDER